MPLTGRSGAGGGNFLGGNLIVPVVAERAEPPEPVGGTATYDASAADTADPADRRAMKGRVLFDGTVDPPRITGWIEFGPDAFKPQVTEPDPDGGAEAEADRGPDAKVAAGGGTGL
jgi:hypothetical protein